MPSSTFLARIERAERAAKAKTGQEYEADCICFPTNEMPFFAFPVMEEIAARVECPVHGRRNFWHVCHIYVSKWLRDKQQERLARSSPQYQKAWNASFPPDLWPAEEESSDNGQIFLRLKDGTKLLALEPVWSRPKRVGEASERS